MAEYQKSKNSKNPAYSKVTIVTSFLFSIGLIVGLFRLIPKEVETRKNRNMVLESLVSLQDQGTSLASEIESLKTQEGIEEKIREKFRVTKDGEGLIVIVDNKNTTESVPAEESNKFLDFFRNIFN